MPGGRAIKYAEDNLGVNSVYERAQQLADEITVERGKLVLKRREKLNAEELYTDAELVFVADMRADNPDLSQTAFEKFIKGKIHQNPNLRKMRAELADMAYRMDEIEVDIRHLQNKLEIATARMGELGGYLHYLAELKAAETASTGQDNWPPATA